MTFDFDGSAQAHVSLKVRPVLAAFKRNGRWFETSSSGGTKPICGALRKSGERCRSKCLLKGRRCRYHGGMSTGPKTTAGLARTVTAMHSGLERWRAEQKQLRDLGLSPPRTRARRRKKPNPKAVPEWFTARWARFELRIAARRAERADNKRIKQ